MITTYKLNTSELESTFIDSIRTAYPNRDVEIQVREEEPEFDETEYLNSNPSNRAHLDKAMKEIENGHIISFDTPEQAIQCAKERAAKL